MKEDFEKVHQSLIEQNRALEEHNKYITKKLYTLETHLLENERSVKRNSIAVIILGIAFFIHQVLSKY